MSATVTVVRLLFTHTVSIVIMCLLCTVYQHVFSWISEKILIKYVFSFFLYQSQHIYLIWACHPAALTTHSLKPAAFVSANMFILCTSTLWDGQVLISKFQPLCSQLPRVIAFIHQDDMF